MVFWPGMNDLFVFPNSRKICVSTFLGEILVWVYTIGLYGQIPII